MALQEPSEWEDDYVVLSDLEDDGNYAPLVSSGEGTTENPLFPRLSNPGSHSRSENVTNESATSSQQRGAEEHDEGEDSDDMEELEYGYETDTLLIMPSMLRDYSHHATNYHPELWRAPIPGSYSTHPTAARCRQEGTFPCEKTNPE